MASNNDRSNSPAVGVDEQQNRYQDYPDPRDSGVSFGSPSPRSSRANGYPPFGIAQPTVSSPSMPSSSYQTARQPINDAVASAFHTTDSHMPPELIQLITQNVIQQLQGHRPPPLSSASSIQPAQRSSVAQSDTAVQQQPVSLPLPVQPPSAYPNDPPDNCSSYKGSPVIGRPTVYTPPSPHRTDEQSGSAESTQRVPSVTNFTMPGRQSDNKRELSPFRRTNNDEAIPSDIERKRARPDPLRRTSTDPDATVLEKYWGKFFDSEGHSTQRLALFLQGIANYLVEELEPKQSLVVTPDKMQKFYEQTKLTDRPEIYPWRLVFDDKTSSISRLLRDSSISVEHHLVQAAPDARPDIPGLTPAGFATWMTLLIRAHPDHEYERLTKVLCSMAINNPEEKSQRFPAALPRRLLPDTGDESVAARLKDLMNQHCKVQVPIRNNSSVQESGNERAGQYPMSPRKSEAPPPPTVEDAVDESERPEILPVQDPRAHRASFASNAPGSASNIRDSAARSQPEVTKAASVTSIEDDGPEVTKSHAPIERKRAPYVAQVGGGKSHDITSSGDERQDISYKSDDNTMRRTKSVSSSQRQRPPHLATIHQARGQQAVFEEEGAELSRSRTATVDSSEVPMRHRSRSNSAYGMSQPARRTRSNSTYANDTGPSTRYHPNRSPSYNKQMFDQRSTVPDVNYPRTPLTPASSVPSSSYPQRTTDGYEYLKRHAPYDPRAESRNDPRSNNRGEPRYDREQSRDRDHDPPRTKTRFGSATTADRGYYEDSNAAPPQPAYPTTTSGTQPAGGPYQYPPNAYREGGR